MKNKLLKIINQVAWIVLMLLPYGMSAQKYNTKTGIAFFIVSAPAKEIQGVSKAVNINMDLENNQLNLETAVPDFLFNNNFVADSLNSLLYKRFNDYYMESKDFPKITYRGKITNLNEIYSKKDGRYPIRTKGTIQIHGQKRELISDGWILIQGKTIYIDSKIDVKPFDYGIRIPPYIGDIYFGKIEVSVKAEFKK